MTDFTPDLSLNALPPQNIDAEEIILGGILFDPNAMGKIIDLLPSDAFYVPANRQIYEAARILFFQGKPIDLMTVSTWLNDNNLLDRIGGIPKLAQLVDRTVSSANIENYVPLVMDKYLRRLLINSGHEIVELGFDTTQELDDVLDLAEQKIFSLTQTRNLQGLTPISDTLINTFTEIEKLHQKIATPGIDTGFYDLDNYTSGFQRSDLIIIAGRPSMGKCLTSSSEIVLEDGSIATIEEIYHKRKSRLLTLQNNWKFVFTKPSDFVDDGIKPVFRLTTKSGNTIETTITHPFLTIQGWRKLSELKPGDKIAVPRQLNVFGTETLPDYQVKLLAYFIGDGCLTNTSPPQFTNSNPCIQEDFSESATQFPGVKVRKETSQNTRTPTFYVTSDLNFIATERQKFAHKLRQIIESQGRLNSEIARNLGVSLSLISQWLQGCCVPNENHFNELCTLLNIKQNQLTNYEINILSKNSNNSLTLWLEKLGLWGKNAHNKTIPSLIFRLNRPLIALFLNRLFATDGWISVLKNGQVQLGYTTVSEKLAYQIKHLLLRFGVISHLKKRQIKYNNHLRQAWQINITDAHSLKTFIEEISIFGKEKAINLAKEALTNKKYQTNCDLIPKEIWKQIALIKGSESWKSLAQRAGIKGYSNIHVNKRDLSRERLFQLALALDNLSLQQLATSEVYWDKIVSIDYVGEQQVYDLTIPETHNFVANNICVHNTSFALNIASNIAKLHQATVAIFSLEMSKEQLAMRLLAGEAKIESNKLRSGRITENEMTPLMEAMDRLSQLPIYIDDTANISVMQIRSEVRRLQAEKKGNIGLILLDYLQLMEGAKSDNRVQELSRITRSLKSLARELNVPLVALSQLSRGVEQRTNKRPMLSDLRESGSIEQDADLVLMLYRDEYYNPDTVDRGVAEIIIAKHRNGPTGQFKVLFRPELTQFLNLQQR
jgi:replicative DNA helicase